ncbi:MAG: hypothetical protein SOI52_04435 [Erysipelotrichaceae bacterium]|jgi:hypothetical protein
MTKRNPFMKYFCEMLVLLAVFDLFIDVLQLFGLHSALIHTSLDDYGTDIKGILTVLVTDGICIGFALPGWIGRSVKSCRILSILGTALFLFSYVSCRMNEISSLKTRTILITLICFIGYAFAAFTSKQ